ncbi:MAG: hypothetical protein ALECFALPRED_001042 [Alectoria fallacina]|uniref:Uncharacterized protein n=1 Tax=Alectoria fallacina TaxID=1903189 RepID=A0A8H3EHZ4_9LECA|nr:MAG: hypothetical protein ALECFALPRED_001042 [Alectoria fallacina]
MRPSDPRIRQTLNQISQNIESANLTTQASLFTFSEHYISPCLASLSTCLEASCQPCFALRDDLRQKRQRQSQHSRRGRGRENLAFDFYDDWEQDESEWGNDELDRLLNGDDTVQPGRHGGMSYGSRGVGRRKGGEGEDDVNMVPKSNMFGFLERLPWKIGGRGVRYKPNVANLQENVGRRGMEAEPLIEEGGGEREGRGHTRSRSGTVGSRSTATTNSLSSRGDLFPSDDEDDAVPLGDEFAMVLERRTTGTTSDDHSSRRKKGKRPSGSRNSTKTGSSRDTRSMKEERRGTSTSSGRKRNLTQTAEEDVPSMTDLKHEEERLRRQEEADVEQRRQAAQRLALARGLSSAEDESEDLPHDHDVKGGAIIHDKELPSPDHEGPPLANPPPELPPSKAEPSSPDRPRSPARDGTLEPKPSNEPNH